ncbi:MAG: DUF3822 family protein [Bacteroidaceae bacterium]
MAETKPQNPTFDTLYIRISLGDIAFAVYDVNQKESFHLEHALVRPNVSLTVNMKEAISKSSIAQAHYRCVKVLVQSTTTIVPINNFDEKEIETLYHFNFPELRHINVFYDTLPYLNAVLLFSLDQYVCQLLEETYPGIFYTSTVTPVLLHFAEQGRSDNACRLFSYLHKSWMDVFAFKNGKLIMSNSYITKSVEDTVYYLLYTAKLMEIDQLEDELFLTGMLRERQRLLERLREYIPNTFFVNPVAEYTRHPLTLQEHIPYDLMTFMIQSHT